MKPSSLSQSPQSRSQRTLEAAWYSHRHAGRGAVLAALADAARQDQFDWRRPGHARDPLRHASDVFDAACREGRLPGVRVA